MDPAELSLLKSCLGINLKHVNLGSLFSLRGLPLSESEPAVPHHPPATQSQARPSCRAGTLFSPHSQSTRTRRSLCTQAAPCAHPPPAGRSCADGSCPPASLTELPAPTAQQPEQHATHRSGRFPAPGPWGSCLSPCSDLSGTALPPSAPAPLPLCPSMPLPFLPQLFSLFQRHTNPSLDIPGPLRPTSQHLQPAKHVARSP